MTTFILIRHGETDFSKIRSMELQGWSADISPLTELGIEQIRNTCNKLKYLTPDIILSSPMTRALETGSIVSTIFNAPLRVEFDLHEWIPDLTFQWKTFAEVDSSYKAMLSQIPHTPPYESLESVKLRTLKSLRKYLHHDLVFVACHNVVIYSIIGKETALGGSIELKI